MITETNGGIVPFRHSRSNACLPILVLGLTGLLSSLFAAQSSLVQIGSDNKLIYRPWSAKADRIPDFSWCGYRYGEKPLPDVKVVKTISPISGDNLKHIQAAIDEVSAGSLDSAGFRGALLLRAGTYNVSNTLKITASGVVIKGEGSGSTAATKLIATGKMQYPLFLVAGTGFPKEEAGTRAKVTDAYVAVGARTLHVETGHSFAVGDRVIVKHTTNSTWIEALGMHDLSKTDPGDKDWDPAYYSHEYKRRILAVNGSKITIDAPMVDCLAKEWGGGAVFKYSWDVPLENAGIEHMRLESVCASNTDENHAWEAVKMDHVRHGWVRDIQAWYFGYSCVTLGRQTKNVSIIKCVMRDPKSQTTGGRKYSFNLYGQLALVKDCYTRGGRHDYAMGSVVPGPNAFVNCVADKMLSPSGPHHRWATGTLYDNIIASTELSARNGRNWGSGHGWQGANTLFWNCRANKYWLQSPRPVAENIAIGCVGAKYGNGFYDAHGKAVSPLSLYETQLRERLGRKDSLPPDTGTPPPALKAVPVEGRAHHVQRAWIAGLSPSIRFFLPRSAPVALRVTDMAGRSALHYRNPDAKAGTHMIPAALGRGALPSGYYILDLQAGAARIFQRSLYLR